MSNEELGTGELSEQDRQELRDLIVELAWRLDHQCADTIHELVTDDVSMAPGPLVGKDAVKAWGKERAVVNRTTSHLMTNFHFRMVGAGRVEGSSMSLVFRNDGSEMAKALPWALTEYNDVFVRQDGIWKFASHSTTDVFFSG
jgi:hypothetical protein